MAVESSETSPWGIALVVVVGVVVAALALWPYTVTRVDTTRSLSPPGSALLFDYQAQRVTIDCGPPIVELLAGEAACDDEARKRMGRAAAVLVLGIAVPVFLAVIWAAVTERDLPDDRRS